MRAENCKVLRPFLFCLICNDIFSKRSQRQCRQFEVLQAEGNTDNGDAQNHSKHQVRKANPNTTQEYPQHIHQHVETSARTLSAPHSFNVCMPNGMPMMVIIISKLATRYSIAVRMPPNISHKKFIKQPIVLRFY